MFVSLNKEEAEEFITNYNKNNPNINFRIFESVEGYGERCYDQGYDQGYDIGYDAGLENNVHNDDEV